MKKSLRKPLLIFVIVFCIAVAAIPVIFFAALNAWPTSPIPLAVMYWVTTGASLAIGLCWAIIQFKGGKETSILYLQLILTIAIQFLPLITWLFFLVPESVREWIFIIPLILDVFAYLGYALVVALTTRLAHKALETLEKVKAEEVPIVNAEQTFNNEDGTFKGSRVKVNNKKD